MTVLISLIGEQPIPNLLPLKHFKPAASLVVHSNLTQKAASRLKTLTGAEVVFWPLVVDAYDIHQIQTALLDEIYRKDIEPQQLIFNITGGTKPMSLAAYIVAAQLGAPVIYLQSEGKQSRLYRYEFQDGVPVLAEDSILPGLITIDVYVRAHVDGYTLRGFASNPEGSAFERTIHDALRPCVDELLVGVNLQGVVDMDLVIRCANQVGILEAKLGPHGIKKAIDQLNTAGGQKYLGTYTAKFLVSDQHWDESFSNLKELAGARQITVIELPGYAREHALSETESVLLRTAILKGLGKTS